MKMIDEVLNYLEKLIPDPVCELNYNKDYELLIAVMLSAQTTDKRVNIVTKELFSKYRNVEELSEASLNDIEKIVVETVFEQYGASALVNPEILSLNQIEINKKTDIQELKNNLYLDFFISVLITVVFLILFFILFKTNIDKKILNIRWSLEKVFLIVTIIVGIVFSILFPLYQIPDELTHINMIYSDLNLDMQFQEISGSYGDTNRIIRNYDEKVNLNEYFDLDEKLELTDTLKVPNILWIRHFPQTIGLIFSSFLELPVLIGITISEILAVLFYAFVCYFALKWMPFKKEAMMVVMLLPMCIQQMGSFSYDSVLLPICFLFISYVLHLKFIKSKIQLLDFIKLIILLVVIALIKIPYALLGGLVVLLPLSKLDLNFKFFKIDGLFLKKYKIAILSVLALLLIPFTIFCLKLLKKISYGRILLGAIKANVATVQLILDTLSIYGMGYLKELTGSFGWLDTPVSILFTIFVLGSMLCIAFFGYLPKKKKKEKFKNPFKKWEIIYLYLLAIGMCSIIILSMFEWTIYVTGVPNHQNLSVTEYANLIKYSIPAIGGVQGRYFIPVIPLFLLPLFNRRIQELISKMNCKFYLLLYYFIVFGYMILIILKRYWI